MKVHLQSVTLVLLTGLFLTASGCQSQKEASNAPPPASPQGQESPYPSEVVDNLYISCASGCKNVQNRREQRVCDLGCQCIAKSVPMMIRYSEFMEYETKLGKGLTPDPVIQQKLEQSAKTCFQKSAAAFKAHEEKVKQGKK